MAGAQEQIAAVTTLDYASGPVTRRIPPWVGRAVAIASCICVGAGIWYSLQLTPLMLEWRDCIGYERYERPFYLVALPLCTAPLPACYVAWRANVFVPLSRACVWAGAITWITCRYFLH